MQIRYHSPSSDLAEFELNSLILWEGDKYLLVERDPWKATLVRWYWYDRHIVRAVEWVSKVFHKQPDK